MFNITAVGRLGDDPQTQSVNTANGSMDVARFSLAVDSGYDSKKNERRTSWVRCTVWGKPAERATKFLHKGDQVTVSGKGHHEEYERKDGGKGYSIELKVDDFSLPPKPKADDDAI